MFRLLPLLAILIPLTFAQNPIATADCPVEVVGQVSPVDPLVWPELKAGPGLFMKVHNLSGRAILGFAFETTFSDPLTGKTLNVKEHSAFRRASRGVNLPSGGTKANPRPYQIPITTSGAPAKYAFRVDLVVFQDGSTWGPGKLEVSEAILMRSKTEK